MTMDLRERLQGALGPDLRIDREGERDGNWRAFVARETRIERDEVVKLFAPERSAVLVDVKRFWHELRLAGSVDERGIVPVLGAGRVDELPYYIQPAQRSEAVRRVLTRYGPFSPEDCHPVLRDLCVALDKAHRAGLIHGSISPQTLIFDGDWPRLMDCGVRPALAASLRREGKDLFDQLVVPISAAAYLAPEQFTADPVFDQRTDIYGLGAVIWAMLMARPPFAGTPDEMLAAKRGTPPALDRSGVQPELGETVMQCLAGKPAERFQTVEEVLTSLQTERRKYYTR